MKKILACLMLILCASPVMANEQFTTNLLYATLDTYYSNTVYTKTVLSVAAGYEAWVFAADIQSSVAGTADAVLKLNTSTIGEVHNPQANVNYKVIDLSPCFIKGGSGDDITITFPTANAGATSPIHVNVYYRLYKQ